MSAADGTTYRRLIDSVPYGKRLPDAVYLHRPQRGDISEELLKEIERAEYAAKPSSDWNILKLHTREFALTFLSYPSFETDPHPRLTEATKINLTTGRVVRTEYRQRANPPILHRKETFLNANHPMREMFAGLTSAEEGAGLYRDCTRIGTAVYWQNLLQRKGLAYEGHQLVSAKTESTPQGPLRTGSAVVERHRTAIKRYDLSKPVKMLLGRGLLRKHDTFFDFGCGHGMDVEALRNLGYEASGWDPAFRPDAAKTRATVVNLGYVLNVIENPAERLGVVREAFSLAERLLVVSTMVVGNETGAHSEPYGDGFLTKTNTFQKFYAPGELETLLEQTLDVDVSTLGLGICVAFRDADEAEAFEARRNRTRIDWAEISAQLRFASPAARERRTVGRYALHKELFDEFWQTLLELGRLPGPGEFDRLRDVRKAAGGLNKALSLLIAQNGGELWEHARKTRAEDVLVYLAMTHFRKRFLRREIPLRIKHDIRTFFGDVNAAREKARDLLYAAGDPDEIDLACEGIHVGWQDQDALYIHRDLLTRLPVVLRLYVACAAVRYGDPEAADIIKLHKRSGKVTFLTYDDFCGNPLPELRLRVKVNLRTLFVQVFEHACEDDAQLLLFKERYLAPEHAERASMEKFSAVIYEVGFDQQTIRFGPDRRTFFDQVNARGLGDRVRRLLGVYRSRSSSRPAALCGTTIAVSPP